MRNLGLSMMGTHRFTFLVVAVNQLTTLLSAKKWKLLGITILILDMQGQLQKDDHLLQGRVVKELQCLTPVKLLRQEFRCRFVAV